MANVPDDWNTLWLLCPDCGRHYHASEGCECWDEEEDFDEFEDQKGLNVDSMADDKKKWIMEQALEATSHLGAALIQSIPSDDQIIMGHVAAAKKITSSIYNMLLREKGVL